MNQKLIKTVLLLILLIFAAGAVSVLASNKQETKSEPDSIKYVIGVSQFNLDEIWLAEINTEIDQAQKGNDSVRMIYTDAAGSSEKQAQDIDDLMGLGIDLLIITPNDTQTLTEKIAAVHELIPVIVLHRSIRSDAYTTRITTDNYKIGYETGIFVAKQFIDREANILEVIGTSDSPESEERSAGFKAAIEGSSNLIITISVEGNWLQDTAEDTLAEMYMDLPNIQIIFAHNDAMAVGAYNAAQKMRLPQIRIVGIGGIADQDKSIELVRDGILECTYIDTLGGTLAYNTALEILEGKKDIPREIILESRMVTSENIKITEKSNV